MMVRIGVFYLFLSFGVFAQDLNKSLSSSLKTFEEINLSKSELVCEQAPKEEKVVKTVVHCECDEDDPKFDKKNFKSFQISNLTLKDLPKELKQHIPGRQFESGNGGIKVVLSLPNDNKMLGLWGVVFGLDKDGDDMGATHGTGLSLSKTKKGMTYTLSGETNLFTKVAGTPYINNEGRRMIPQHFTNENMLRFMVDNIYKDKVMYYKLGVGWIQLDSKNAKGLIQASAQQKAWHELLDIYGFDYIADGNDVRQGFNLDAFMGVQKNLRLGSSCRVRFFGESGARISMLNDDYFKIEGGSMLYFQKPKKNFGLNAGAKFDMKVHDKGQQYQTDLSLGAHGKNFGVEFIYHVKQGDLRNHTNYNLPNFDGSNDPTMSLKFTANIFGGGGRNQKKP